MSEGIYACLPPHILGMMGIIVNFVVGQTELIDVVYGPVYIGLTSTTPSAMAWMTAVACGLALQ